MRTRLSATDDARIEPRLYRQSAAFEFFCSASDTHLYRVLLTVQTTKTVNN